MLPKPDKSKKNIIPEQQSLSSPQDNDKKLRRKRSSIFFLILCSAGISLLFWAYRNLPSLKFVPSIPRVSIPSVARSDSPIPPGYPNWSIYVQSGGSVWTQKYNSSPKDIIDDLNKLNISTSSALRQTLPPGVDIVEMVLSDLMAYQINVPTGSIYILLQPPPGEGSLVPKVVDSIYWNILRR